MKNRRARASRTKSLKLEQLPGSWPRTLSSGTLVESFRLSSRMSCCSVCVCVFVSVSVCLLCRTLERPSTCQRAVLGRNLQFTDESEEDIFWAPLGVLSTTTSKDKRLSRHFSVWRQFLGNSFARRCLEFVPILETRLGTPDLLPPIGGEEEGTVKSLFGMFRASDLQKRVFKPRTKIGSNDLRSLVEDRLRQGRKPPLTTALMSRMSPRMLRTTSVCS